MAEASTYRTTEVQSERAVTPRAIFVAVVIIIITVLWDEWMAYYMSGSNISRSHFPLALLFPFLSLAVLNIIARRFLPSLVLTPPELRVVLGMGLVAAIVPYDGVTGHLIVFWPGCIILQHQKMDGIFISTTISQPGWHRKMIRAP
jgi:hypothetical protein